MISIIIPTLNEESGIANSIKAIPVGRLGDVEIIIVDSYSTDRTVEIARSLGAEIVFEKRRGYGRAYKSGFDSAKGNVLVALDGDGTYPAGKIPELLAILDRDKIEFMTTNRFSSGDQGSMSALNKFGNRVLSFFARLLFSLPFRDSQSGMWILRKSAWGSIRGRIKADGMAFSQEIKIEAWRSGLKCREEPIEYDKRFGKAKLNPWRDGIGNLASLFIKRLYP